jgi:hypothetical protein
MHNELTIERFGYNNKKSNESKTVYQLKKIGSDSLFYFAIFLSTFFLLQLFPFVSGLFNEINIGVNEVIVSVIGFINVFFLQVFNKILNKAK